VITVHKYFILINIIVSSRFFYRNENNYLPISATWQKNRKVLYYVKKSYFKVVQIRKSIAFTGLLILILVSSFSVSCSEDEFSLDLSVTNITPTKIYTGDTVSITVEIANVSSDSSEKLWGSVIFIDQELLDTDLLEHMTINEPEGVVVQYDGNEHQGTEVWPGDVVYSTLTFTLDDNAPGGVYQIPIALTGKRGPCNQGCHPWREDSIFTSINVIHGIPAVSITFLDHNLATIGDTLMIDFTLKNLGSDDAMELSPSISSDYPSLVGQINLKENQTIIQPSQTLDGTIAIYTSSVGTGDFEIELLLAYQDRKDINYEQSKSVSFSVLESNELTYEELGDAHYESAQEYLSNGDYKNAIVMFSQAKGYYGMAGADEKSDLCVQGLDEVYGSLSESLTPEPVVKLKDQYYLLVVGLAVGFVVTMIGFIAGMARSKK